jgi:hypothetical protein
MIRYIFALTIALGAFAGVAAAVEASAANERRATIAEANQTVVMKTSAFPVVGPITVEECAVEDCSDTVQMSEASAADPGA